MKDIFFVADYFIEDLPNGGGEINNDELIRLLQLRGHTVRKVRSNQLSSNFVYSNKDSFYVVANFVLLPETTKRALEYHKEYCIIVHDHPYVLSRNPALYKYFSIPENEIINKEFLQQAKVVFGQSQFHCEIMSKNLKLENIINLGGNLWSNTALARLGVLSKAQKTKDLHAVLYSDILHKNTSGAVDYCSQNQLNYRLIGNLPYSQFLSELGQCEKFIFLPKTPETLSRVCVEAKMMGLKVITNNLVGATSEDWFKLSGQDLIDVIQNKRIEIVDKIENIKAV